jgi:hypothetical protein
MQAPERLPLPDTMTLAAAAIDLVVFIARTQQGRKVASIRQVTGIEGSMVLTNELFRPGPDGEAIPGVPIPVDLLDELVVHGYDATLDHTMNGWTP